VRNENVDYAVMKDEDICVVCGKQMYDWEHIVHIIPYISVHKECADHIKNRKRLTKTRRKK
jgi:hypothetical protein